MVMCYDFVVIGHLEFRNKQSDVCIICVYLTRHTQQRKYQTYSAPFSVLCVCVCVHTLTRCLDLILRSFFLTGIQILEISSSSHSRRGNKVQISPFSPWNRHERPLLTESDPICSRSCCTRRQNSGFRSGMVCGSNESNTSIHLHYKSHPEAKPSESSSSWSDKNPKIPAKASLENPHEPIIDNFTRQYFSDETKPCVMYASSTHRGRLELTESVGSQERAEWLRFFMGTLRICFTRTPFSAQANHIGKLGGRADAACARNTDPSAAHSWSRSWRTVRVQMIDSGIWHDPLSGALHWPTLSEESQF